MADREALKRRLEAAAYVCREAGMTQDDIIDVVLEGIQAAEADRPQAANLLDDLQSRRRVA